MHGASIKHFLPRLLSLRNEQNELVAAFGMRAASTDKLFLENYLDEPIEEVLRRRLGVHVERHDIIEVGNLSSSYPGATRKLIVAATSLIHQEGYKWVVFTGTTAVRNGFNRLGIKTVEIGNARVNNLSEDDRALWGSYYENAPMVIAGNVELGFKMLANDLLGNDRAEGSILMAVTEIRK